MEGQAGWCGNLLRAAQVEPGENVLVVVDEPLATEGAELVSAAEAIGAPARLELWTGERPLAHAPAGIVEAGGEADACFHLQAEPRGEEAGARIEVLEAVGGHGGRMIFMGLVDGPLLRGELSAEPPDLSGTARALLAELEGTETLRIRGRAGTDLTLRVGGRTWLTDALPLEPGGFGNYPGGEVFVAPHSDGADGLLVADLTVPYTVGEGLVDEPVRLTFEGGRVTSIEGGDAAGMLRRLVEEAGDGADVIAELGIGFFPGLEPRGHVMLDEKAAGTAHVAIGRSTGHGGDNESSIHVDCVFSGPELEADGRPVELPR